MIPSRTDRCSRSFLFSHCLCWLAALVLIGHLAAPAFADRRAEAGVHAKQGQTLQSAGKYAEAIAEYQKAYDLVPHPLLLFDIGQCYRLKGDYKTAADYYDKYLAAEPNGRAAPQARQQLSLTRAKLAEQHKADEARKQKEQQEREKQAAEAKQRAAEEQRQAEARRQQEAQKHDALTEQPSGGNVAAPTDEQAGSPGRGLEIGGMVAGAAGAALLGTGVYYGLRASSLSDELSQDKSAPWTTQELNKDAQGKAAQRNMIILTVSGGVAIAGGVVLYVMGRRQNARAAAVSLSPLVSPSLTGVAMSGQF